MLPIELWQFVTNLVHHNQWALACTLACRMNCESTSLQLEHSVASGLAIRKCVSTNESDVRAINIEVNLAADTRRIFEALTVPEYMEAWLSVPGYHSDCHATVSRRVDGFAWEHFCNAGSVIRIAGSYSACLRRKLIFSWKISGGLSTPESRVDIRLYGYFERSILRLRHLGLQSDQELSWHTGMWTASLTRLNRILGGAACGPRPHGLRGYRRRPQPLDPQFIESIDQV